MNLEHASKSSWLFSLMAARSCSCRRLLASFRASSGNARLWVNVSLFRESDRLCMPTLPLVVIRCKSANSGSAASEYRPVHVELRRRPHGMLLRWPPGPPDPGTLSEDASDDAADRLPPPSTIPKSPTCGCYTKTASVIRQYNNNNNNNNIINQIDNMYVWFHLYTPF